VSRQEFGRVNGEVLGRTDSLIKVSTPIDRIESLAKIDGVRFVRSPYTPVALNYNSSFDSAGINLTGASLYHAHNYLGRGIKIAVLDLGFASLDLARETGEIPEEVIADTEDYTGSGALTGTAHGTGVAEIVHDMAPAADLFLKKIGDEVDLGRATTDAISQDIDIIVHSVGWLNTNFGDGTGVIAETAERATNNGILWVNAAGNSAQEHWEGPVSDRDGDGWLEFEGGKERIKIENVLSRSIDLYLTWNDWPSTGKDLDLFLYDGEGRLLRSSDNYQTGTEPPAEQINYSSPSPGEYYLKVSGPEDPNSVKIEIFSLNQNLDPAVQRSSIMAPGNAEGVFTVGAINKNNWVDGPIEPFSSRGPTTDGRTKPDLTGIDGVTLYTYRSFLGTSAAAPSVAGAGALILSRSPDLDLDQLKEALKENAKDLGPAGPDNTYGTGRMRLIFNSPSVIRTIERENGASADQGEVITVTATAKMPFTLQGGLTVRETVPEPLEIREVVSPNSHSETGDQGVKFEWPIVEPGTNREMVYRVLVPEDAAPGDYEIEGTINGNSTDSTKITVSSTIDGNELVLEKAKAVLDGFSSTTEFTALGENVDQIRVRVHNLQGKEVFDSNWRDGNTFQWNLMDDTGKSVPNGVYLYYVTVKGPEGDIARSELDKTLVLR
jgi:subtilisin family serine protease